MPAQKLSVHWVISGIHSSFPFAFWVLAVGLRLFGRKILDFQIKLMAEIYKLNPSQLSRSRQAATKQLRLHVDSPCKLGDGDSALLNCG